MNKTPTEYRQDQADRFAAGLGLDDGDALYRAAIAAWGNLNPQIFTFEGALSVAGVALAAARQAGWRKCRHCHSAIYQDVRQWAARPAGGQPVMFCPENQAGHEPEDGDGQRRFTLAADPVRYGHDRALMREVIEIDPAGRRSVLAVVPDSHAFDIQQLLGRVYDTGRQDAAEDAADAATAAAALDEPGQPVPAEQVWAGLGVAGETTRLSEAQDDA